MLNLIRENITNYDVEIYAYCIMPNHIHLLIRADLKELASFMAKILATFAKYYNQKHNRVGYVFQGRYGSQCVESIGYFWNCLRYIHKNSLHVKNVKSIVDYEYSSMRELYYGEKDILPETIFQFVNDRFKNLEEFLEFHNWDSRDTFEDILDEVKGNRIRIAKELLKDYGIDYQSEEIEILDYIKTRKEYEKELSSLLGISMCEVEKIVKIIRKELEGTG